MKIEKGIPIKDARVVSNRGRQKYPWDEMEIGDSFAASVSANALRTTAAHHTKRLGYQFTVRKDGDGARAWRVA